MNTLEYEDREFELSTALERAHTRLTWAQHRETLRVVTNRQRALDEAQEAYDNFMRDPS